MANIYGMNSSSYDKATSSPLPISELVRKDGNKRPKLSLSAKKQKQTCLWGCTLNDSKTTSTTTTTCTSPAQESNCTAPTVNKSFETVQEKESDTATVANVNDDGIIEEPTQVLLGQEIDYATTQGSTQENKWDDSEDNEGDKKPAAVDTTTSYHNFKEDDDEVEVASEDEVELIGVSTVVKTEASLIDRPVSGPNVYCDSCNNFCQKCHELAFGEYLVQEAVSWFEEKDEDEQKLVTAAHVRHEMKWNYNRHLNFSSWDSKRKYDNACWHDMPGCLLLHSVTAAVDLIRNMQLLAKLKADREGGAAKRYTKYPGNASSGQN